MAIYIKTSNTDRNAFMPYNRYPDVMAVNTSGGLKAPTITKCLTASGTHDVHVPDYVCFSTTGTQSVKYTTSYSHYLQYSYDKLTWNDMAKNTAYDFTAASIYIKVGTNLVNSPYTSDFSFFFTNTVNEGPVTVSGNIAALMDGCGSQEWENPQVSNTKTPWSNWPRVSIPSMFSGATALIDASGLILPWKKLSELNMMRMFRGCTNLISGPIILLEEVEKLDMSSSFQDATSLQNMPEIMAKVTVGANLNSSFMGCTSLMDVHSSTFLDDASVVSTFTHMFDGCTSIQSIDEDFITRFSQRDLPESYYSYMFYKCSSLVEAPYLRYTDVNISSMDNMFALCTSLTDASKVHMLMNKYANASYRQMFWQCSSLETLPTFDAQVEVDADKGYFNQNAFQQMFRQCTSLQDASSLSMTITGYCQAQAFQGFMEQCSSLTTGVNKLVIDIDETAANDPYQALHELFAFNSALTTMGGNGFSIKIHNAHSWGVAHGMFYEAKALVSAPSLVQLTGTTNHSTETFAYMFYNCQSILLNFNNVHLDWTDIGKRGAMQMFLNCYYATGEIAEIPCTDIGESGYEGLFQDCANMGVLLPNLPATTAGTRAYAQMFWNVGNDTYGGTRPVEIEVYLEEGENCTENMFAHMQAVTGFTFKVPAGNPYGWVNAEAHNVRYYYDKEVPMGFTISEEL